MSLLIDLEQIGLPTFEEQVEQLKQDLRAKILRAELLPGTRILEEDLRNQAHATVRVARRALNDLAKEGLLNRKRHLGTIVAERGTPGLRTRLPRIVSLGVVSAYSKKSFETYYFDSVMKGVSGALHAPKRIQYFLNPPELSKSIDDPPLIEPEVVREQVQGLVGIEANYAPLLNDLVRAGVPVVTIDFHPANATFDGVVVDHFSAGYLATEHLLALGHRRIAFIGESPNRQSTDPTWQERLTGFLHAMAGASGESPTHWILGVQRNERFVRQLLPDFHRTHDITAYVLSSGSLAEAAVHTLEEIGARCPQDISLVAADNATMHVRDFPLSHARVDYESLGRGAIKLLASRIACRPLPAVRSVVPVGFQPGRSSGRRN